MPMPGDFNWRPNDNSATTLLRYELEAEKWVNAVSSAQRKTMTRSLGKDLIFVGLIIQLFFCLILLVLLFFLNIFKWMLRSIRTAVERSSEVARRNQEGVGEERANNFLELEVKRRQPNPILYDSNGNLWGIWDFLFSFIFIFICVYVVIGIVTQFFKPEFNMADRGFLYFACAVSGFFALTTGD